MSTKYRLFTNFFVIRILFLPCLFVSLPVLTMPKYNARDAEVNAFQAHAVQKDPLLRGTMVMADDKSSVLYVSPSSKKVQTGLFQQVVSAACDVLEKDYQMTYLLPNVPVEQYVDFAKTHGSYSPFFDYRVGNYVRQAKILSEIAHKVAQIQQIKDTHRNVIAAYEKAKALFEDAQKTFNIADAAYNQLDKNVHKYYQSWLDAETDEERIALKIALDEAKQIRTEEKAERKATLQAARRELSTQQIAYQTAKEIYDQNVPSLDDINKDVASLMQFFQNIENFSAHHFTLNEQALQAFENTSIGLATASYSIWGEEEARIEQALASFKSRSSFFAGVSVVRLPIHNIRLKKPISTTLAAGISGNFNGDASLTVEQKGVAKDSLILSNQSKPSDHAIFTKNERLVKPEVKTLSGDGAGTYQNLVTRGAVCTGTSQRHSVKIRTLTKEYDGEIEKNFEVPVYQDRKTNVLAQSVALEYDFFVRSEPIGVNCSLDIQKFRSFVTTSGESGFLFWRESWSEDQRTRMEKSGISCELNLSPLEENLDYEEQRLHLESIKQAMMQEIAAEFLFTYAKSWQAVHRSISLPNPGKAANQAGVAVMSLCGANPYCVITAIVLKTGDELFGAHYDSVTTEDYLSGTIKRSYDETSWTTSSGQAIIDLIVTL